VGKKTDDWSVWYSCSKSEGKAQVTNATVELTKAQRVIKAFQQYFTLSPTMPRYVFQLAIPITLLGGWGTESREKQKDISGYLINLGDLFRTALIIIIIVIVIKLIN